MFCRKCGAKIEENVRFCPKCGTAVTVPEDNKPKEEPKQEPVKENKPEEVKAIEATPASAPAEPVSTGYTDQIPTIEYTEPLPAVNIASVADTSSIPPVPPEMPKKSKLPWVIGAAVLGTLLIAGGVIFGLRMYNAKIFEEQYNVVVDDIKDQKLDDAEGILLELQGRSLFLTKDENKVINEGIDDIHTIKEAKERYEKLVSDWETGGKYALLDKKKAFSDSEKKIKSSIDGFKPDDVNEQIDELEKLMADIKKENESRASHVEEDMDDKIKEYPSDSCEYFILSAYKDAVAEHLSDKNYVALFDAVDDFENAAESLPKASSAPYVVKGFTQVDVSEPGIVKLYINTEDRHLDENRLQVYESISGTGDWKTCLLKELSQVQGDLTIDLVADISTSMTPNFSTMQKAVTDFTNSTFPDTKLGLSLISSIYSRVMDFTKDSGAITSAVNNLYPEGSTSLYQSMYSSVMYTAAAVGPRCVIAFTDGVNEPYEVGYDITYEDVIDVSQTYQVPVYIIGIGDYVDSTILQNIADRTGGEYYNINQVYDLSEIYKKIYYSQQKLWEATYESSIDNSQNRKVYVLYYDADEGIGMNFEEEVDAKSLQYIYNAGSGYSADNLLSFYSEQGYISADDLTKVTKLEDIQTIINIYFAKNGYAFTKDDVLSKMISVGAISQNGSLSTGDTLNRIKSNPILYANYSAIYNRRFEIIYPVVSEIYRERGGNIGLEEMKTEASRRLGESDRTRFAPDITSAYRKASR